MKIVVSLAQMDILLGQVKQNLATAKVLIAEAAERGSDIVVLPELWSTGSPATGSVERATTTSSATRPSLILGGKRLSKLGRGRR